ncbi:hypothetical protein CR513_13594, partial [Mucuna pruriens]
MFGVLEDLINDQRNHFCNRTMSTLLEKYGVVHQVATSYHPRPMGKPRRSLGSQDSILNLVRNVSLSDSLRQSISPPG